MPRNYSIKETIRQIKEKKLKKESQETTTNSEILNNYSDEEILDIEIPIQKEFKTKEFIERFDRKETSKKKDTIIQSITKKFKWW